MKTKEPAKVKVLQVRLKTPEELRLYKEMRLFLVGSGITYQEWGIAQIREVLGQAGGKRKSRRN